MKKEVRKLYFALGVNKLSYDLNALLAELYPHRKCYVVNARNVDMLLKSFFDERIHGKVNIILSSIYSVTGHSLTISEISKKYYFIESSIKEILNLIKKQMQKPEIEKQIFEDDFGEAPYGFINLQLPVIYSYILENEQQFKANISSYQVRVLYCLMIYPKIKKSLAVYIYEYIALTNRKHLLTDKIKKEFNVYIEGENIVKRYGFENFVSLLEQENLSKDIMRYIFEEYSLYILALTSNSKKLCENLLSVSDDKELNNLIIKKYEEGKVKRRIDELYLSNEAYKRLRKQGYEFIIDIPLERDILLNIPYIGGSIANEIITKLNKWYKEHGQDELEYEVKKVYVSDMNFSTKIKTIFRRAGFRMLSDIPFSKKELLRLRGLGENGLEEIVEKLKEYNITVY